LSENRLLGAVSSDVRNHVAVSILCLTAAGGLLLCGALAPGVALARGALPVKRVMPVVRVPTAGTASHPFSPRRTLPLRVRNPRQFRAQKAAAQRAYQGYERRLHRSNAMLRPHTAVFGGIDDAGLDAAGAGGSTPPDTTGAIGPSQYVELVNSELGVYSRAAMTTPVATVSETAFVGAVSACDGQIQWDQQGQRWLYAALECASNVPVNKLFFGWSKTPVATAKPADWCQYEIDSGSTLEDYPKLGHDDSQIIIGMNKFVGITYTGSNVFLLDKPAPGHTACPGSAVETGTEAVFRTGTDFTPVPATIADASATGYVVATSADNSHLTLYEVGRNSSGANVPLRKTSVAVPAFAVPASVPQPSTSDVVDSSDTRLTQAVAVTDPATGQEGIWTQHTIAGPGGGPSVVRWYELTPGAASPRQIGTVAGPNGTFAFNAAISPTANGSGAAVLYNSGDGTHLIDLRAQDRTSAMTPGQTVGDLALGVSVATDEDFSCNNPTPYCRWGDYNGASPDPTNGALVWGTGELTTSASDSNSDAQWGSQNVAIAVSASPPTVASTGSSIGGASTATLTGTVNPEALITTYHFEYGTTPAYGSATAEATAGSDTVDHAASASIAGLAPGTYHFRLVATNAGGIASTSDATFAIPALFPPPTSAPAAPVAPPPIVVVIASSSVRVKHGKTKVTLICSGGAPGSSCRGTITLTKRERERVQRRVGGQVRTVSMMKTVVLARANFSLATGSRKSITLKLRRSALTLLAQTRSQRLKATANASLAGAKPKKRPITLVA
jgi:hypothetical protein